MQPYVLQKKLQCERYGTIVYKAFDSTREVAIKMIPLLRLEDKYNVTREIGYQAFLNAALPSQTCKLIDFHFTKHKAYLIMDWWSESRGVLTWLHSLSHRESRKATTTRSGVGPT